MLCILERLEDLDTEIEMGDVTQSRDIVYLTALHKRSMSSVWSTQLLLCALNTVLLDNTLL